MAERCRRKWPGTLVFKEVCQLRLDAERAAQDLTGADTDHCYCAELSTRRRGHLDQRITSISPVCCHLSMSADAGDICSPPPFGPQSLIVATKCLEHTRSVGGEEINGYPRHTSPARDVPRSDEAGLDDPL